MTETTCPTCGAKCNKIEKAPKPDLGELKQFIRTITLDLQKHREKTPGELDDMFQKAYRLYHKYNVEGLR